MNALSRILVTGGAGFVGSHVAEYYAERDVNVVILDNISRRDTLSGANEDRDSSSYNRAYLSNTYPNVEFVNGDVRDTDVVEDLVEGCDGVVHTAGQVAVTSSLTDPQTDFEVNVGGTLNVLEAARKAESDPAVVFASTNKVYGNNVNEIPVVEEETRYRYADGAFADGIPETLSVDGCEHTPYGVSKLSADLYVQDYAARGVVDAATFRMSCIYGPRQFGIADQGWVAHFILSTLQDEPLTIFGDGKQVRDVLYVDDLVRAYDAFIRQRPDEPTVFNLGGGPGHTTSLLEFIDLLEAKTGKRPHLNFEDWREGDQKVYVSDISWARKAFDWKPRISFEEGVDRFLNWYETEHRSA